MILIPVQNELLDDFKKDKNLFADVTFLVYYIYTQSQDIMQILIFCVYDNPTKNSLIFFPAKKYVLVLYMYILAQ